LRQHLDVSKALVRGSCLFVAAFAAACGPDSSDSIQHYGSVQLEARSGSEPKVVAKGFFFPAPARDAPSCYVSAASGACQLWKCDDSLYAQAPEAAALSAGKVIIAGTREPIELEPSETDEYAYEAPLVSPLWNTGDRIDVEIAGSEFPRIKSFVFAPAAVEVSKPSDVEFLLDPSADLPVTWSSRAAGYVYVTIGTETPSSSGGVRILPAADCAFPASNGAGTIPTALLTALPKPSSLTGYAFDVLTLSRVDVVVDRAALTFQVSMRGYSGRATVE
jgi:hypothetical protein